jgi:hypothetical protein
MCFAINADLDVSPDATVASKTTPDSLTIQIKIIKTAVSISSQICFKNIKKCFMI